MQSLLGRFKNTLNCWGTGAGRLEGAGVAARDIAGTLQDVFDVHCSG